MPSAHAVLSPSSSERWLNCPPSALDNAAAPRKDTVFTREGTLAHAMAEAKAVQYFACGDANADIIPLDDIRSDELYQKEMDTHTDRYVEHLKDLASEFKSEPYVQVEKQLQFHRWIPESFGTADCIMIGTDTIHVVDFKYGKGVEVSAERNPQMMIYALGAIDAYSDFIAPKTVKMTIIQPRLSSEPSTWEIPAQDLLDWADNVLMPAAKLAYAGKGDRKVGDWCRWCVNAGVCRAQFDQAKKIEAIHDKNTLSNAEIAEAIELGEMLSKWLEALKEKALGMCLDGIEVPGLKAVEGRSVRAWKDQSGAFDAAMKDGIPQEMLWERKPITLTQLETIMGKKHFGEVMKDYITRPEGKPTLVKATDKRNAITRKASVEDDFNTPIE